MRKQGLNLVVEISFYEPDRLHTKSATHSVKRKNKAPVKNNVTVADVAQILENKYHLIERFTQTKQPKINNKLLKLYKNSYLNQKHLLRFTSWLQREWRDYIVMEGHEIETKIATKEGRQSFMDTHAYYKSLQVSAIVRGGFFYQ